MVLRKDAEFFGAIVGFALAVSIIAFLMDHSDPLLLLARLLALNGFISLAVAAIMDAFLKEITLFLKRPFLGVHHYFAAVGLAFVTVHPIVVAFQTLNPSIVLPNFSSLYAFFLYGGSIALIVLYVAFGGALLRQKIAHYWRPVHMLMYLALFFGVVHANLFGMDLQNIGFRIVYLGLFGAAVSAFGLKRWQLHQIKERTKKLQANNSKTSPPAAHP